LIISIGIAEGPHKLLLFYGDHNRSKNYEPDKAVEQQKPVASDQAQ
jgi:hypothetical protein